MAEECNDRNDEVRSLTFGAYLTRRDDPVGDDTVGCELAAALPAGQVVFWPGAGHLPWLDDAVGFGSLVSDFLADARAVVERNMEAAG